MLIQAPDIPFLGTDKILLTYQILFHLRSLAMNIFHHTHRIQREKLLSLHYFTAIIAILTFFGNLLFSHIDPGQKLECD